MEKVALFEAKAKLLETHVFIYSQFTLEMSTKYRDRKETTVYREITNKI